MSMTPAQQWAFELAHQIKAIQTSWADDEATVRREAVQQELERALARVPAHEREERMAALRAHFPVPGSGEVRVVTVTNPAPPQEVTAEDALEILIEAGRRLPEAQRKQFAEKLLAAGYRVIERRVEVQTVAAAPVTPAATGGAPERIPDMVARKLGLPTDSKAYPAQVFNVVVELADSVTRLSNTMSTLLTELRRRAGEPPANREEDLKTAIGKYLTDQPGGSLERMRSAVERTHRRLVELLKLPNVLPNELCRATNKINPDQIVENIRSERGELGLFANAHKLYWERFVVVWKQEQFGSVDGSPVWEKKAALAVLRLLDEVR